MLATQATVRRTSHRGVGPGRDGRTVPQRNGGNYELGAVWTVSTVSNAASPCLPFPPVSPIGAIGEATSHPQPGRDHHPPPMPPSPLGPDELVEQRDACPLRHRESDPVALRGIPTMRVISHAFRPSAASASTCRTSLRLRT